MKKVWVLFMLALALTGCGTQQAMETISDEFDVSAMAEVQQINLSLPEEAAVATLECADAGKLYLCDGYSVTVQTMEAGDLDRTLRNATGFSKEQLTVMQTSPGAFVRYDCVWCAVGEGGDQTCRGIVLDDGNYHYVVTVMADATMAGELTATWQHILDSAKLVSTD